MKIGDKLTKIDIKKMYPDIEKLIEDLLIEIAEKTFIDIKYESCNRLLDIGLNLDYEKEDFIRMVIHSIKQNKVLMCDYRAIGKSSFLSEVAKYFKIPIVARCKTNLSYDKNIKVYKISDIKDGVNTTTLLADDITLADVRQLRDKGFKVIGFIINEKFY